MQNGQYALNCRMILLKIFSQAIYYNEIKLMYKMRFKITHLPSETVFLYVLCPTLKYGKFVWYDIKL